MLIFMIAMIYSWLFNDYFQGKGKEIVNLYLFWLDARSLFAVRYQGLLPTDYFVERLPHNNIIDALSQDKTNLNMNMHDGYAKCTQLMVSLFHNKGLMYIQNDYLHQLLLHIQYIRLSTVVDPFFSQHSDTHLAQQDITYHAAIMVHMQL